MENNMKDLTNNTKKITFGKAALFLACSLATASLLAKGPTKQQPAAKNHKYKIATGADQVLSAIYDPTTNTIRVSGGGSGSGGGTVTNVGLSMPSNFSVTGGPITSSGTLSVNWAQPIAIANGGTGQTSAASAFNALAPPTAAGGLIYGTGTNTYGNLALGLSGQCLGSNGSTLVWTSCGLGTLLTLGGDLNGTLVTQTVVGLQGHPVSASAPAGGQVLEWNSSASAWTPTALPAFGTVSSVGLAMPSIFNLSGSPITTSGMLTVGLASQAPNTFFAGPTSGAAGVPAFRALTGADIPAINLSTTGNGGIAGVLSIADGGTGLTSAGSSGQCLASNGASLVWTNCATGSVTSVGLSLPSGFSASGSPVTTSGTLGISMPTGWSGGSLLVGNGANSVAALPAGSSGQCLTSSGTALVWGSCGTAGTTTTFQVNGLSAAAQSPINFQNGGYISVSNPSAGNIQFNFNGPLGVANGGTGLTALGANGQCLGSNGTAMIWQSCGSSGLTLATNGVNDAAQSSLNLVNGTNIAFSNTSVGTVSASVTGTLSPSAVPAINLASAGNGGVAGVLPTAAGGTGLNTLGSAGQCLQVNSGATALQYGSCGSGSGGALPSTWAVGSNNAITMTPTAPTDTTPLTVASALSSGGTADIFDVCQTSPCNATNKFFWVTWNGNLGFQASNLQLSTTGPAPYLYLNGINGYPGQPYLKTSTAELGAPTLAVSNAATGGTIAAGTYYFKITYVNAAGETTGSTEQSTTTTGSTSTVTVTAPGARYSAFGYQIYEGATSGSEKILVPTSSYCTLSAPTYSNNAVCAPTSNAVFTSFPTAGSLAPPTTNTTGGAYIDSFAPAADGLGMFLASGAPGADAPIGSGLVLPGGTGVNLTSGATTIAQTLACFSASETVSQCGANAANTIIGVFSSSGQNSLVQTTGIATINLAASATTTANDYACSNATAGTIVDNGTTACPSGQQVGLIAQTNGAAVTNVPVLLRFVGSGSGGSSGSGTMTSIVTTGPISGGPITTTGTIGCPSCLVTNPSATQTITPGSASVEGLAIQGNGGTTTDAFDVTQNTWNTIRVNGYGQAFLSHSPSVDSLNIDFNQAGTALNFVSAKDHITHQLAGNTDISGQIAVSSATSASYTFALGYSSAPVCVLTPTSNPGLLTWWVTTTAAAVTANLSASGTLTFNYHCFGAPN